MKFKDTKMSSDYKKDLVLTMQFLFFVILFLNSNFAYAQENSRWKQLTPNSEFKWDVESARKIDSSKVRFWYENPFLEEQRAYLVKWKIYSQAEANSIFYGRVGIVANCKSMEFGIFSGAELNEKKTPIGPGFNKPIIDVQMQPIEPATIVEGFVIAVCKHFKLS
jgi:hypothetical protein